MRSRNVESKESRVPCVSGPPSFVVLSQTGPITRLNGYTVRVFISRAGVTFRYGISNIAYPSAVCESPEAGMLEIPAYSLSPEVQIIMFLPSSPHV